MKWVLLFCVIPSMLNAQNVLGVQNKSVIIRNTDHVGQVGDEKWVVRSAEGSTIPLGKVKINKSVDDLLLADITTLLPGCKIAMGDEVTDVYQSGVVNVPSRVKPRSSAQPPAQPVEHYRQPAWSRRFRIGLSSGALIPYRVIDQLSPTSYHAGILIQYSPRENSALMLDAAYSLSAKNISPMLPQNTKYKSEHPFVFDVQAIFRYGLFGPFSMDLGAGGYIYKIGLMADTRQSKVESLQYYYGVCGGLALECLRTYAWSLLIVPRYHAYYADKQLVDHVTAGIQLIF